MTGITGAVQSTADSGYNFIHGIVSDAEIPNDDFGDFLSLLDDEMATIDGDMDTYARLCPSSLN